MKYIEGLAVVWVAAAWIGSIVMIFLGAVPEFTLWVIGVTGLLTMSIVIVGTVVAGWGK